MSAETPTSAQLRRLGAVVLITIFGLGIAASRIPEWLKPESLNWVVTVPVNHGADGIEVGSRVLIGGLDRGQVIDVEQIKGDPDGPPKNRELIRVEFELDRTIVLARNAVIKRGSTTAGNIGYLDIKNPGSLQHRFKPGEERVIPIDLNPVPGGSMAGTIGRTNGEMLERIESASERFTNDLRTRDRFLRTNLNSTQAMIQEMDLQLDRDSIRMTARLEEILDRYRLIFEQMPLISEAALQLEGDVDVEADTLRTELQQWRQRLSLIDVGVAAGRENVDAMRRFTDRLEPRLQAVALDLQSALEDANSIATRTQGLTPEFSDNLNRTMARMVLAGGQLKLAMKDLLPLAIQAITTRPDRASESRRRLLESTDDVVLAGMELRDAARFLEEISSRRRRGTRLESDPPPNLDQALRKLEETMKRLAERLRHEIEADLR